MKKAAFITGGTGGLGMALSTLLASKDWLVFAADCDEKALSALEDVANITPVFVDVTSSASIEAARKEVSRQVTQLDAVVNFAGILRVGAMVEIEEDILRQLLDINLLGSYRVNKVFFPLLSNGRIVNISSETGWHTTSPFNGPYAMSKYGIEAYSHALRRELSIYGIPVITIQPGPFKTSLVANTVDGFQQAASTSKLYKEPLAHFGELVLEANKTAAEPDQLADVIYKALTAKRPRHRYSVKADLGRSIMEYLPMSWADMIFRRLLLTRQQR